jgi:hypothetical protein
VIALFLLNSWTCLHFLSSYVRRIYREVLQELLGRSLVSRHSADHRLRGGRRVNLSAFGRGATSSATARDGRHGGRRKLIPQLEQIKDEVAQLCLEFFRELFVMHFLLDVCECVVVVC